MVSMREAEKNIYIMGGIHPYDAIQNFAKVLTTNRKKSERLDNGQCKWTYNIVQVL